eukprot:8736-Heterococcus_DN1.PRE.3
MVFIKQKHASETAQVVTVRTYLCAIKWRLSNKKHASETAPCSGVGRTYHNQLSVRNQVVFVKQSARKRSIRVAHIYLYTEEAK